MHHLPRQFRRSQDEVDPHPLFLGKPQLGVVPVGVHPGSGCERAHHIGERRLYRRERRAFRFGDVGAAAEHLHVPHILVGRGDVPVTDQCDPCRRVAPQPLIGVISQCRKPIQLVTEVRVFNGAAIGNIEAPQPNTAAGRTQRPGLGFTPEHRLIVETDRNVVDAHPGGDGHPVPLVVSAVRHFVTGAQERHQWELFVGALGLLHGEHVDIGACHPVDHPLRAGPDRVDVPGGDSHRLLRGRQCPKGSGTSPGIHDSPGTPQPLDLAVRLAARACRPTNLST